MPNAKTRFIAGAVVGATVNVLVQSTQMAMDYDRPFDWSEFFLCTGAGAFVSGPRLCRRPAAETWIRQSLPKLQRPDALYHLPPQPDILEPATTPNHRRLLHTILSAALIAWAICGKHTLKFSRATRLPLWFLA